MQGMWGGRGLWAYDEVRTCRNRDSFQWSKAMPQLPYSMGEGCPGDEESVWVSTIPCGMGGSMKDYSGVIAGSSILCGPYQEAGPGGTISKV